MNVVVTGGAGFIGSNLAGELLRDYDVTVIDNLSTGRIENLDYGRRYIIMARGGLLRACSRRLKNPWRSS